MSTPWHTCSPLAAQLMCYGCCWDALILVTCLTGEGTGAFKKACNLFSCLQAPAVLGSPCLTEHCSQAGSECYRSSGWEQGRVTTVDLSEMSAQRWCLRVPLTDPLCVPGQASVSHLFLLPVSSLSWSNLEG